MKALPAYVQQCNISAWMQQICTCDRQHCRTAFSHGRSCCYGKHCNWFCAMLTASSRIGWCHLWPALIHISRQPTLAPYPTTWPLRLTRFMFSQKASSPFQVTSQHLMQHDYAMYSVCHCILRCPIFCCLLTIANLVAQGACSAKKHIALASNADQARN